MRVLWPRWELFTLLRRKNEGGILSLIEKALEEKVDLLLIPVEVNLGYFLLDQTKSREEALSALEIAPFISSLWVEELKRKGSKGKLDIRWLNMKRWSITTGIPLYL